MTDVYLLPGTMCDERMWADMFKESPGLVPRYLTIGGQNTIELLVEDIAHQLPTNPIDLVGFSLGGYLAVAFALKYPERVRQLFVISNMPCALPFEEVKERTRTVQWLKKHGYSGIPKKRILNLLDKSAHENTQLISTIAVMDKDLGGEVLMQQLLATTQRENLFDQLVNLQIEKHFIVGESDKLASPQALADLAAKDNSMSLRVVEKAGHMLPMEKPDCCKDWLMMKLK